TVGGAGCDKNPSTFRSRSTWPSASTIRLPGIAATKPRVARPKSSLSANGRLAENCARYARVAAVAGLGGAPGGAGTGRGGSAGLDRKARASGKENKEGE